MKSSVLFRRFTCGIAALLVSGGAAAEGVRLSNGEIMRRYAILLQCKVCRKA